jgi:hypothetical protein
VKIVEESTRAIMSSFEDSVGHVPLPTAADEARVRERHPEAFAGEHQEVPVPEELEAHDFRYNDGVQFRQLGRREQATLNEGHLSAHGRETVMARVEAELDNNNRNEETTAATAATGNTNTTRKRKELLNPITLNAMREGVVDEEVYSRYVNEIIHFIAWLYKNKDDWLTEHCKSLFRETNIVVVEDEKKGQRQKRIKAVWLAAVKGSSTEAIIHMEKLTPEGVMEFVSCQAHQKTGKRLSQAGYNGKRSAVQHLVRCHQGHLWSGEFEQRMKVLWRGFSRLSTNESKKQRKQRKRRRTGTYDQPEEAAGAVEEAVNNNDSSDSESEAEEGDEDDRNYFMEGKSPMTTELFESLCGWFMEWGTIEGVFASCFLVFTWHLACRSNNTGKLKTSHLQWTYFDALHVRFRHTKTQKHGEAKRHKRACYSNPFKAEIDLPFVLGLYLATAFNTQQKRGMRLFPGGHKSQSARMGNLLKKVLQQHAAEVIAMGYDSIEEIGLHSIRKGVSTYLASMPGGPAPAALCLRAGWSMGQVKDIYFHQTDGGDEFVGRCASLLNMVNGDFAISPAFFDADTNDATVTSAIGDVFPHFNNTEGMERILNRCLASLLHHRDFVLNLPANHVARSIPIYRQSGLSNQLQSHVKVLHSWETTEKLSGIPPHIKSLVDIGTIKEQQKHIVEKVYTRVMEGLRAYFDERAIGGGQLTEARMRAMINDSLATQFTELRKDLDPRITASPATNNPQGSTEETTIDQMEREAAREVEQYPLRVRNGVLSRIPNNFEFPKAGVYDLWVKWNIGDTEQGVPPLRLMKAPDFAFLDNKPPLPEQQFKRKSNQGPAKRRPSRKIFSDLKFVSQYIEAKARDAGMDINDRSNNNVRLMYEKVEASLYEAVKTKRGTQLKWRTVVTKLRKLVKQQNENG